MREEREFERLIEHGKEERNLEYKQSMNWSDARTKAKLTKCILAMANLRDGGDIVVGVGQDGEKFIPKGMEKDDFESFKQDDVSTYINNFADPYVKIEVVKKTILTNMCFVVIQVEEFEELPVICKRNGGENLRQGAIYTRSRRRHETSEVRDQSEMREIIEMAVEKGLRKLLTRIQRAGLLKMLGPPKSLDSERYDKELGEL